MATPRYLDKYGLEYYQKLIKKGLIEYILGTQTEATNAWTGVSTSPALFEGKVIVYHLPYAGTDSAATLNLTMTNGDTTGAIPVENEKKDQIKTDYRAGSDIFMVYTGTAWRCSACSSIADELATESTKVDILRRKVLALSAGVKDLSRWALQTYYEVASIDDGVVTLRFGNRKLKINMNPNTPGNFGLLTHIYGYEIYMPGFYGSRSTTDPVNKIYLDGREKSIGDLYVGFATIGITVYKQLRPGYFITMKYDPTGIHLRMLYETPPETLPTLFNPASENPNFRRVFYQVGGEAVEVIEVPTGRSITMIQSATWTPGEWHLVDILW